MPDKKYQSILSKAPFGYAYHRIILDDMGVPVDYEFLEVNKAFEKITSLRATDIIGKRVCEVIPGIREDEFDWVACYGEVALNGNDHEFEQFSEPLNKWFRVQVSSPEKEYFTTIFTDISSQYKLADIAQIYLTYTPENIDYQYIIDTACEIAGAPYGAINIFEEDGRAFSTLAFAGMNPFVKKMSDKLGFQLINKKWTYDPVRQAKIDQQKTTVYNSLSQLTGQALPSILVDTITTTFNLGKFVVVKTEKQGRMLGDFTLMFLKNTQLQNQALLETFADMTGLLLDRLNHERELARDRIRLEQITSQITDIVWRSDMQLNNNYISPSVQRVLGFTVEEYKQLSVEQRYPRHVLPGLRKFLVDELIIDKQPNADKNRTRIIETELYKSDGSSIPIEVHVSFVRDNTGNPIGLQGVSRDISERKKLEQAVNNQARLRELLMHISSEFINIPLEKMDDAIQQSLETLGTFVNADRSYTFDYDWEKNICNNTFEWCDTNIEPQLGNLQAVPLDMMPDWVIAHKKGEAIIVPDVFALPHGLVREILEPQRIKSVLSFPLMNEGKCIGFVGFDSVREHRNYSEAELQLLKLFAQMLVNAILRKATVEELIAAKERAEESDRLKSAFLANISHEIRTPMNGIIGFLDLLRQPNLNEEDRASYLDIVNESGERLLNTINSIIELSRIESGDTPIDIQEVDLPIFMSFYHDFFSHQSNKKGIVLKEFQLALEKEKIFTDKTMLDSILTNLIKNAIKFTDQGSIEVGCTQQGNDDFLFYVKDTGKGIKADKLEAIFGRFVQEDSSFTRNHEGSGLGLSIAKAYVDALGGKIWAESEPGKGSCFYFRLPVIS
ncbi:MAG: PAS domain-containing sensor histidine kinase [Paludibacter sp.]|nr:PAS domain-containing sensor histidine kinase [Paludibacter sp.]